MVGRVISDEARGYGEHLLGAGPGGFHRRVVSREHDADYHKGGVQYEFDPVMEAEEYHSTMTMKTTQAKRGELTSNKKNQVESLEVENGSLRVEIEELRREKSAKTEAFESELKNLKKQLDVLKEENEDLKRENKRVNDLIEKDEEFSGKWRRKFRELENRYRDLVDQFDLVVSNHKKEKKALDHEMDKLRKDGWDKDRLIEELNKNVHSLSQDQNKHLFEMLHEIKEKNQGNDQSQELIRSVLKKVDELFQKSN